MKLASALKLKNKLRGESTRLLNLLGEQNCRPVKQPFDYNNSEVLANLQVRLDQSWVRGWEGFWEAFLFTINPRLFAFLLPASEGNHQQSSMGYTMSDKSAVVFENVARYFGEVHAVDSVSMEVRDGEFFSMLGPSGSGKTTCLRL